MKDFETNPSDAEGAELVAELAEGTETGFVAEEPQGTRNATMALLGLMLLGGAVIYLMHIKAGPQEAAASTEAVAAQKTISDFLTDGGRNLRLMHELLRNTEKVVQQFASYPSMTQVKLEELKTNPFRFTVIKGANPEDEAEKARKLAEKQKAEEKARIAKEVQGLKLQSVIHSGKVKACMIGNKMYQEGQEANGFLLEKITSNSVVVKQAGYRFELRMQH